MMQANRGIAKVRSRHSVVETVDRLEALARSNGLIVFARIDFSGDAARAGLAMPPMQQLVFGNPKAGTPLLVASPESGLDLPLRALSWQDAEGVVWLSFNEPSYIGARHGLLEVLTATIAAARTLMERAAAAD
jgi:uncharacterized protein (DUF302 family)